MKQAARVGAVHTEVGVLGDDAPVPVLVGHAGWHDFASAPGAGLELEALGRPITVLHGVEELACVGVGVGTRPTTHPDPDADRYRAEIALMSAPKQFERAGEGRRPLELLGRQ